MADSAQKRASTRTAAAAPDIALNTRELDVSEGRSRWNETINRLYGDMDVNFTTPSQLFDGEWGGRAFGDLHVSTIRAQSHVVHRTPGMVRDDSDRDYLLVMITDGQVEVQQFGRTTVLENGAFAVLDCGAPFVFEARGDFRQVVARAPRDLLTARLPQRTMNGLTARNIPGGTGGGALFGHLLRDIAALDSPLPAGSAMSFSSSALDMLVTLLADSSAALSSTGLSHAEDLARVQQAIERTLHDPDHTLADIGAELGMSVRYIQKLFSTYGTTPRAWLYQSRLERARKYLVATDLTVVEVSERVGFRDVSHFSRTFRSRFDVSPGQYRRDRVDPAL
ncbi:AraC family transcriptional regulator [Antrihabitans sp. YC2-6]|uniref:AraC family transcriptional regulator n=1 Tax=Antrihabitans sp. YC2-6 TaxID=2799498 RepID=UPI0018F6DE52|nr:AraC family transcriptional regulator [Antrihabitans sp. YC2-6]MBJ8344581.1 AraC family transcriptional regulator [Antrihabitans sp. YC2-6]